MGHDPSRHRIPVQASDALRRPPPDGAHCHDVRALRRHRRVRVLVVIARHPDTTSVGYHAGGRVFSRRLDGVGPTFAWLP
jgi:hypothetical protein